MVAPISPVARNVIFACAAILPAAAAAAYPYKKTNYSIVGVIAGLMAIATIGIVLFHLS
jgi:hypothetical protein